MAWQCITCSELIDEPFDACWNCGTWRSGKRNRRFRRAERVRPESLLEEERATISLPPAKLQFSTRFLLTLTAALAIACAMGWAVWTILALAIASLAIGAIVTILLTGIAIYAVYGLADKIKRSRRR